MRKAVGSYRTNSVPGKTAALIPEFEGKTCLRQNCSLGYCACSEGPALGENTHDDNGDDDKDFIFCEKYCTDFK